MSDLKYYAKIKDMKGPVKVKGFEDCFELEHFEASDISNHFSASNNGQAFRGVPTVSPATMVIKNPSGNVSSELHKRMLNVTPLDEVVIHEITKIKGAETSIHDTTYAKAHLLDYKRGLGSNRNDIGLVLGSFASIETAHHDIDETGATKKYVVKYDLQKSEVS